MRESNFSVAPRDTTSDNGHKKTPFIVHVVQHWNRLSRGIVGSLTLLILKTWLDTSLSNLLLVTLLEHWVGLEALKSFFPT